jgi:hypothetical protein
MPVGTPWRWQLGWRLVGGSSPHVGARGQRGTSDFGSVQWSLRPVNGLGTHGNRGGPRGGDGGLRQWPVAVVGGEVFTAGKEAWCGALVGDMVTTLAPQRQREDTDSADDLVWPNQWRWYGGLGQRPG